MPQLNWNYLCTLVMVFLLTFYLKNRMQSIKPHVWKEGHILAIILT